VSSPEHIATPAGGPQVRLLDARGPGLDPEGLRRWARTVSRETPAKHRSRSYRFPFALVAWHERPVGVDLERVEALGPEFLASISTPAELESVGASGHTEAASSRWSSKEALAKALGDAVSYDPRRLESPERWPDGRSGPWRAATIDAPPVHVAWLCWRAA
jgi:hypothetical protein